jgi:heme/copper-type cytochrome/quinol oxidase subunit 2
MKILVRRLVYALLVILGTTVSSWAQCAMCRASVENNISEGSEGLSAGLNTGILYLFVTPYLMVAVIGFIWYWKSQRKDAQAVESKGHS